MKIICLHQWYGTPDSPGSGRHFALLKHLARYHQITVITSDFLSPIRSSANQPPDSQNPRIIRLKIPYQNRMGPFSRLRAYLTFVQKARAVARNLDPPDLFWAVSGPITVPWLTRKLSRKSGIPWIFEVQDLWPDFPLEMMDVPQGFIRKWSRRAEIRLYRHASSIVCTSPDYVSPIRERSGSPEKVHLNYLGTDFGLIKRISKDTIDTLLNRHGLLGRKIVLYAGSFGRANDIPTILLTAERLSGREDITFVLIGEGFHWKTSARLANRKPHLIVLPETSRSEALVWLKAATVSLVTFIDKPVLSTNSPSRFFDSLGCGTPVIVTNRGWTKTWVEENRCGCFCQPENPVALSDAVMSMLNDPGRLAEMSANARLSSIPAFDRDELANQMHGILTDATGR